MSVCISPNSNLQDMSTILFNVKFDLHLTRLFHYQNFDREAIYIYIGVASIQSFINVSLLITNKKCLSIIGLNQIYSIVKKNRLDKKFFIFIYFHLFVCFLLSNQSNQRWVILFCSIPSSSSLFLIL
jgi:hypothetical protein